MCSKSRQISTVLQAAACVISGQKTKRTYERERGERNTGRRLFFFERTPLLAVWVPIFLFLFEGCLGSELPIGFLFERKKFPIGFFFEKINVPIGECNLVAWTRGLVAY